MNTKAIMITETWHDGPNSCLELLEGTAVGPLVAWRVAQAIGLDLRHDVFLRDTDVELV